MYAYSNGPLLWRRIGSKIVGKPCISISDLGSWFALPSFRLGSRTYMYKSEPTRCSLVAENEISHKSRIHMYRSYSDCSPFSCQEPESRLNPSPSAAL